MKAQKGYFKWVKTPVWIPDEKGKFTLHPLGMVLKEGEGTVLIKGFDPIKELEKQKTNDPDTNMIEYGNAIGMKPDSELTPRELRERKKITAYVKNQLNLK